VRSLGLEPLDFDQVSADLGGSPFVGQVVRQGMDLAKGIVALFTPDEFSALRAVINVYLVDSRTRLRAPCPTAHRE
jgi:hypothetical protein